MRYLPYLFLGVILSCQVSADVPLKSGIRGSNHGSGLLADSGFRPNPDGFSFANWGQGEHPHGELAAEDIYAMFGEGACAVVENDECELTEAAELWMNEMNRMMDGGHCEGMAALSAAFFTGEEESTEYGEEQPYDFSPDNADLLRNISAYFVTQTLEPVMSVTQETMEMSLQEIIETLRSSFESQQDYYTLGIYSNEGGHAVTPYALAQTTETVYLIYVYDNNFPGEEKYIEVDVAENSWTYAAAAINPREDFAPWVGSSGTMDLTPLSARYEELSCPFCGDAEAYAEDGEVLEDDAETVAATDEESEAEVEEADVDEEEVRVAESQADQSDLGISIFTDVACNQLSATHRHTKNTIKQEKSGVRGGYMRTLRGVRGCFVHLPESSAEYELEVSGEGGEESSSLADMLVVMQGAVVSLSGVQLNRKHQEKINLGKGLFEYFAGSDQSPLVKIAGNQGKQGSLYELSHFSLNSGRSLSLSHNRQGRLQLSNDDPSLAKMDILAKFSNVGKAAEVFDYKQVAPGQLDELLNNAQKLIMDKFGK